MILFSQTYNRSNDLILHNGNVITLNGSNLIAQAVYIRNGIIQSVGTNEYITSIKRSNTTFIDCEGQTVMPGFIDPHCHIFSYASSLISIDCRAPRVRSIGDIKKVIHERSKLTIRGEWIRATGYDEFDLVDGKNPTRWDLDEAAPFHPVKLTHRSGHACILNSVALNLVGITNATDDPEEGFIDRDVLSGEPNGLLIDMEEYLEKSIPNWDTDSIMKAIRLANEMFLSYGVTSIGDATHTNTMEKWGTLKKLKHDRAFMPRLTMMISTNSLDEFISSGLTFRSGDEQLNLGHMKIMLTNNSSRSDTISPHLNHMIRLAHRHGFPVAIHAVESNQIEAACDALLDSYTYRIDKKVKELDRIEHCSECTPTLLRKLFKTGAMIVTQPGFIYRSGDKYISEVSEEIRPWLYPIKSLLNTGLMVSYSSDSPVIEPNPLNSIDASVRRLTINGRVLASKERVNMLEALKMHTICGAHTMGQATYKGSLVPGKVADLILLNDDPIKSLTKRFPEIRVTMTMIGGKVVWSR